MIDLFIYTIAELFRMAVDGYYILPADCPDGTTWAWYSEHSIYACKAVAV